MSDYDYLPGAGWQLAGARDDGTVWAEPIIAWEFMGGTGAPVIASIGSAAIIDPTINGRAGDVWLVPPGERPENSRYRPAVKGQQP